MPETPARHDASRRDAHRARRGGLQGFLRGREHDPVWVRPCLLALLVGTAVLYLWGLGASGWANTYYSAAVQAGTKSWKAFFFGSFDASNSVTVDKSPLFALADGALGAHLRRELVEHPRAAGARRRRRGRRALPRRATLVLGRRPLCSRARCSRSTPVAALMFRFNNPDAALVLLLVVGAYAMVRALERGSTWWLVLAFSLVGFGFLAKMLQALLVLPAFGLVYLIAAPVSWWKRVWQLTAGVRRVARVGGLVDRDRRAVAGVVAPVHRRFAAQQRPRADLRVQRLRPPHRQRDRQRRRRRRAGRALGPDRAHPHVRRRVRHPDLVAAPRRADPARRRHRVARHAVHAPTACAPRSSSGADGSSSPGSSSASARGSSTSTTRSRSHRRSARSSAWARACSGSDATTSTRASCSRSTVAATAIWSFVLLGRTPDWNPWLRGPLLIAGARRRRRAARRAPRARTRAGRARDRGRRRDPRRTRGVHAIDGEHAAHRRDPDRRTRGREHDGLRWTRWLRAAGSPAASAPGQFPGGGQLPGGGSPAGLGGRAAVPAVS